MSGSEREFRQQLLNELHQIREHLKVIRADVEDMRQRLANIETGRIKRAYG